MADKRKEEMSIDISALANRSGGLLIFGIEEEEQPPHVAKALSPIDPLKCSKERLDQIVISRIKPPIPGLLIRPVMLSGERPSGVAYVVKIPRSHTAHQASDKRYYRRVNFGNQPMDDDEIRQTMNRQTKPTYHIRLTTHEVKNEISLSGTIQNTSVMVARDVSTVLLLPEEFRSRTPWGSEVIDEKTYVRILNDFRRSVVSQLNPFETMEFRFGSAVKIPDVVQWRQFPAIIRVYDHFGEGHESEFWISLVSSPRGLTGGERQQHRDDVS
jgi:hypothetical protein